MKPLISLTLIVKNEEPTLPACLASAAGLVDEIIVVDTGSADRTKEVAAGLGARVVDFPWCDDFAAARNEGLKHATGKWIFWLDADERLDEVNREKFRALVAGLGDENAAYVMKQRSGEEGGTATEVDQVRLFRNHPQIRWRYRVHEQILPALRETGYDVRFTDLAIEHSGYIDAALRRRKTERNLRLLLLEDAERPGDPFTLFNLGWAYQELGRVAESLPLLVRSLERSRPADSIVHKLYTLIAQGYRRLGRMGEAMAACRAGRARCPDDAELLDLEANLRQEAGDLAGAIACRRQLVNLRPSEHFASLDAHLRGPGARHQLAMLYRQQSRPADAETEWQAAVMEHPDFTPGWLGLAELYLSSSRWADLDQAADQLDQCASESHRRHHAPRDEFHHAERDAYGGGGSDALGARPDPSVDGAVLKARGHLARKEFPAARQLLEETIGRHPDATYPRVILTHALLQENTDLAAAERALRDLLERQSNLAESWRNLAVLLRHQRRPVEALAACQSGRVHCPHDAELALFQAILLREMGDLTGAETCLLHILESPPPNAKGNAARHFAAARRNLAAVYHAQGRLPEAETQSQAALAEEATVALTP
jgi:tetratricopeptide (TPR) repeat protein